MVSSEFARELLSVIEQETTTPRPCSTPAAPLGRRSSDSTNRPKFRLQMKRKSRETTTTTREEESCSQQMMTIQEFDPAKNVPPEDLLTILHVPKRSKHNAPSPKLTYKVHSQQAPTATTTPRTTRGQPRSIEWYASPTTTCACNSTNHQIPVLPLSLSSSNINTNVTTNEEKEESEDLENLPPNVLLPLL